MREINMSVGASLCCPICSDYSKSLLLYCLGLFLLHRFHKLAKMFMCNHKGCILLVQCSPVFDWHELLLSGWELCKREEGDYLPIVERGGK